MTEQEEREQGERISGFAHAMSASVVHGCLEGKMPPEEALLGMSLAMQNVALSVTNGDVALACGIVDDVNSRIKAAVTHPSSTVEHAGTAVVDAKSESGLIIPANDGLMH